MPQNLHHSEVMVLDKASAPGSRDLAPATTWHHDASDPDASSEGLSKLVRLAVAVSGAYLARHE